ncbi:TRAP transporter substrate-binding protein DctP [Skermanella rosea]|uniref:TRAP transporter substrate-binding protein DctP n=1 Tax=Skermanella rosea TaxID=1817965 RepID=UPI00193351F9|nr:TRAP transporter substrate-binding protein DctP [Skermanella rosea]UEM04625.1 TRAP transporter substrate-binding protein DctP [Skermanella rosea]
MGNTGMWKTGRLLTGLALGAALTLSAAAAGAQTLKISHQWKAQTDARDRAVRVFVEEVGKKAPDLKFRIFPGRSLIQNPVAQFDSLQNNSLEMAIYPLVYAVGKVPEFSITIMPGLVSNLDEAVKLKDSAYHKRLQEIAHANGVHIVTWWWTPGGFASKNREIQGPDTVSGLKMRAADPYFETVLQAAGASVQSMPSTEIYSALQTGVLDGVMTSAESFVSMRIYEQTSNATVGGDNILFMLLQPLIMSKQAWDNLTPDQQKAFEEAATVSEEFFNGLQREADLEMKRAFEEAGADVRPLTDAEFEAWVDLARETAWKKFETEVPNGKELIGLVETSLQNAQ